MANYNAIYGSFATLPLFLVWIYLGWMFILTGAQVAYACPEYREHQFGLPVTAAPSLKLAAAFDIMDCVHRAFAVGQSITSDKLLAALPTYGPPLIVEVTATLENGGLLHLSRTDHRLLPAAQEKICDYGAVVAVILGTEAPDSEGGKSSRRALAAAAAAGKEIDNPPAPGASPQTRNQD